MNTTTGDTTPQRVTRDQFALDPLLEELKNRSKFDKSHLYEYPMDTTELNRCAPPIFFIIGMVGNLCLISNLCTSVRLRDNLCSRLMCHLTYFNILELMAKCLHFWVLGLGETDVLNSDEKTCKLVTTLISGTEVIGCWQILIITLMRTVHMYNPMKLSGMRSHMRHYSVLFFVGGLCLSFVNVIRHQYTFGEEQEEFDRSKPPSFRGIVQQNVSRLCPPPSDQFHIWVITTVTIVAALHAVILGLVHTVTRRTDYHSVIHRHYKSLTAVIVTRGTITFMTRVTAHSAMLENTKAMTPFYYQGLQYVSLLDCILAHWIFLFLPRYRSEMIKGVRFYRRKEPQIQDLSSYANGFIDSLPPSNSSLQEMPPSTSI